MPFTKQKELCRGNILVYKVEGTITEADYTQNLIPEMQEIIDKNQKVRLLCDVVDFSILDMEWTAMWEDAKFGYTKSKHMSHYGLICKHPSLSQALSPFFSGIDFKSFSPSNKGDAIDWIYKDSSFNLDEKDVFQLTNSSSDFYNGIPFLHTTKFMVAIGRGEASKVALGHALNLIRGDNSDEELHLITVIRDSSEKKELLHIMERSINHIEKVLGPRSEESKLTLRISRHVLEAVDKQSVAKLITETAANCKIDYIVMGTEHAKEINTVSALFSPSVAAEVLKHSPCPVLICEPHQFIV